jgi:hypothetical protein
LEEFAILLTQKLGEERQLLMQFVNDSAPFHAAGTQQAAEAMAQEVEHCEAVEQQRLATELRLIAKSNERIASNATGDTSFVFNVPVASVQTGAGSTANVSQNFDSQARTHLTAALEKLLADLNTHDGDLPFDPQRGKGARHRRTC